MLFKDRADAGQQLAEKLLHYQGRDDVVVIGLPRGGVVVAAEVAKALQAPLDIIVPRKIGAPGNPEFALGALSEEGETVSPGNFLESYPMPEEYLTATILKEQAEAQRRLRLYRGKRIPLRLEGKVAIVIDDGIATGATMLAAILSARKKGAKKVVVAVPVLAEETIHLILQEADELVYVQASKYFGAVGRFYQYFDQTSDEEVMELMRD